MLRLGIPAVFISVLLAGTAVATQANAQSAQRTQNFSGRDWETPPTRRSGPGIMSFFTSQERVRGDDLYRSRGRALRQRTSPQANANVSGIPDVKDYDGYTPEPLVALRDRALESDTELEPLPAAVLDTLRGTQEDVTLRLRKEHRQPVLDFYAERDFAPLWVGDYGLSIRARRLLDMMAKADEEGLEADQYLPASLTSFDDDATLIVDDEDALARLDVELTIKALRYAHDASAGRVDPNKLTRYNDLKPRPIDATSALAEFQRTVRPDSYLAALHPTHPAYKAMRAALAELRANLSESAEQAPIPEGRIIRPGMSDPRIAQIRKRLENMKLLQPRLEPSRNPVDYVSAETDDTAMDPDYVSMDPVVEGPAETGDTAYGDTNYAGDTVYDDEVVEAVRTFQKHAGIGIDGIIGPRTLAAFNNRSDTSKIEQLVLNMERMRWMPRDFGDRYVLVNQPAFELRVYDDGEVIHTARVVVGKPRNQTPAFSDTIRIVEFNPYWNVPQSIAVKEMLPQLRRDPGYLARQGYQVLNSNGHVINSRSVNWWRMGGSRLPVRIRQPPGRSNALGEVKFLFPNKHAVYLHDTPAKKLFERNARAFSHGCVRVQNAREFADVLLKPEGWSPNRIAQAIGNGRNQSLKLDHKINVHLVYLTAWPDEDGVIRYRNDIYGRDARLERALGTGRVAMR